MDTLISQFTVTDRYRSLETIQEIDLNMDLAFTQARLECAGEGTLSNARKKDVCVSNVYCAGVNEESR